ncbi:MAG: PID-CTERM protein-sorting domain-containing protein [Thermaurantimonas sp.]|uniref:PID-CTERM protein-sorting domain-containing protein n=1 Tax=Thermaurantimonas sp. TaxID=2681568 RepID=UPI003918A870
MKNILVIAFLLIGMSVMAQPGMPNNPTPIDGISILLIASGAALGISKYRKKQ